MNRVTPTIRTFAARLITHGVCESAFIETIPAKALQVCQKLRPQLITLMGKGGFHALMTRAIALAKPEVPWLSAARVNENGTVEGWNDSDKHVDAENLALGSMIFLAQLLGLIVAFIGPHLTLQIANEVWPDIQLNDLDFIDASNDEKTS